jgi:hypothetical protein
MKIAVEINIDSLVYNEETMRRVLSQLAQRLDAYIYDSIDNTQFGIGDGPIHRPNFKIATGIKLVK